MLQVIVACCIAAVYCGGTRVSQFKADEQTLELKGIFSGGWSYGLPSHHVCT